MGVDEIGAGDGAEAVGAGGVAGGVYGEGVGDADLLGEAAGCGGDVVDGDAEEHDATVAVFFPCFLEIGHFAAAGAAPRGPEVEDDDFACQPVEGDFFVAVECGEGEGGGWCAGLQRGQVVGEGGGGKGGFGGRGGGRGGVGGAAAGEGEGQGEGEGEEEDGGSWRGECIMELGRAD